MSCARCGAFEALSGVSIKALSGVLNKALSGFSIKAISEACFKALSGFSISALSEACSIEPLAKPAAKPLAALFLKLLKHP